MNIDRLIDIMIEADNNTSAYYKACQDYKRKHGHVAYINMTYGLDDEKKHIVYMEQWMKSSQEAVQAVVGVLDLEGEQVNRLYAVVGAVKKWYEKTNWERYLSADLLERIERYIFG